MSDQRLENKIDTLTDVVSSLKNQTEERWKHEDEFKRDMKSTVWGGNGSDGLDTKVDRLEQIESQRKWMLRTTLGASAALIVERIIHSFK